MADSIIAKIRTLFEDKEGTIPLFPRTKVKAVSDDDGTALNVILDDMNSGISTAQSTANAAMPKSGGTFTGTATFQVSPTIHQTTTITENKPSQLTFGVTQSDNNQTYNGAYIAVYDDHDAAANGANMVIRAGGNMVIGGGESATSYYNTNLKDSTTEHTYITADGTIYLVSNCNTIANAKTVTVNTDGTITTTGANRNAGHVRNSEVRKSSATGTLQTTGKIIYVRK